MLKNVSFHVHSDERQSVNNFGCGIRWVHSFLFLAFATRCNQKHSSYVTIWFFLKFRLAALLQRADYMKCFKLIISSAMF